MHNDKLKKSCSFTGHRPSRFSFGYDENDDRCARLKTVMREQIMALVAEGVAKYYSGMALGVDTWAAEIVLDLKKSHSDLRLIAVRPCETQADHWTVEQRERHFDILEACDDIITMQLRYSRAAIFERNKYLIDIAGNLLAVYDGGSNGGTAYTVGYGRHQQRRIIIINPDTSAVEK